MMQNKMNCGLAVLVIADHEKIEQSIKKGHLRWFPINHFSVVKKERTLSWSQMAARRAERKKTQTILQTNDKQPLNIGRFGREGYSEAGSACPECRASGKTLEFFGRT